MGGMDGEESESYMDQFTDEQSVAANAQKHFGDYNLCDHCHHTASSSSIWESRISCANNYRLWASGEAFWDDD